jgi:hypothetical protein
MKTALHVAFTSSRSYSEESDFLPISTGRREVFSSRCLQEIARTALLSVELPLSTFLHKLKANCNGSNDDPSQQERPGCLIGHTHGRLN